MASTKNSFEDLSNLPDTTLGEDSILVEENKTNKRKELPSASSDDGSPVHKKHFDNSLFSNSNSANMTDKDMKETVESMRRILDTLATKSDFDTLVGELEKIRNEIGTFSRGVEDRIERIESRVHDVEQKLDEILVENNRLKTENESLRQQVSDTEKGLNDLEQYGRRMNLKVFNLKEDANETAEVTTNKVCEKITNVIGIETKPEMIEACHRLPVSNIPRRDGKPKIKPIIIRFKDRRQRDNIFQNKSKCKDQGFSIGEDLTRENARRCQDAHNHASCKSSWSTNGKIWARLNNDKKVDVPYGANIDQLFQSNM